MRVLVYGLGRSGLAVARLAARQGHQVAYADRRDAGEDIAAAAAEGFVRVPEPAAARADLCIAAPGVPIDHPDLRALRARGTETIGEVEWVARTVDAPMVGITGTAGKGTVTRWTHAIMQRAGMDPVAGGNLGPALAAVATPGRWQVAELSSFQLERCPTLSPDVAVVTNLGRDHLDRHGSVDAYHAVKRRITDNLRSSSTLILNADDPAMAAWAEGTPARVVTFSVRGAEARARLAGGRLWLGPHDLGPEDALRAPGLHQRANLLAAALAAEAAGVPPATVRDAIPTLTPLPGRHALVAARGGVRFVNDSIATRELAVAASLEAATPPVAWIAGGRDKGADVTALRPLVRERVAVLLGIGEAGPALVDAFADLVPTERIDDADGPTAMAKAVRRGAAWLHPGGGTVLLAPLAASFDQFADYQARGRAFEDAVDQVLKEAPWTACC
ncbi:MAG: UDP-N-acetylmuramoyl-L-alanine--D-glutamate ligase [Trueperaceae bacterium]|nr:UDP-N-acetylmuramoyl-L-alanine--D-glutamate ligase [Trueperaceae bacterium]